MKIFNTLIQTSPFKVFISLLLSTLAGVGYALLIPIILNSFNGDNQFAVLQEEPVIFLSFEVSNYRFAALFLISCLVILGTRTLSQLVLSRVAIDTTSDLRIKYYNGIVRAPLSKIESVGSSRLIASFTTDVKSIIQGAMLLPDLLISTVTIIGMMSFLLYLNTDVFYLICGAIAFGSITFVLPMMLAGRFFKNAREKVDQLQEGIKGNIYGIKELKLCESRRKGYIKDVLLSLESEVRKVNKTAITIVRSATNYGDMISFFVIGFVTFIFLNYHSISQSELLASVMILLYITGPVSIVMNSLPDIITANISFVKVNDLFKDMPVEMIEQEVIPINPWSKISFSNVTFSYSDTKNKEDSRFIVGPVNFELHKGEVCFIVGGNGSGKSTLAKLITSHYLPDSGAIYLGEQMIDQNYVTAYRDQISAIYSNYYLFDRLLGDLAKSDRKLIDLYLKKLQLNDKVKLENGKFSTLKLSDGQRKRLALLISFLEDKSIYLFDEWAADQDPEFKEVFYYDILPSLKAKGKVVIVISHDDRYFDSADRVLKMESGQLNTNACDFVNLKNKEKHVVSHKKISENNSLDEKLVDSSVTS